MSCLIIWKIMASICAAVLHEVVSLYNCETVIFCIKIIEWLISYPPRSKCLYFIWFFLGPICVIVYKRFVPLVCLWNDLFSYFHYEIFDSLHTLIYMLFLFIWFIVVDIYIAVLQVVMYLYVCKLIRIFFQVDWLIYSWLYSLLFIISPLLNTSRGA